MIDHVLHFDTEAAAQAALPSYWTPASKDSPGAWRGDICIPSVSVYALDVLGGRVPYLGWHIVIALPALDPALRDLPGNACRLITDREAAVRGEPFVRYAAPDMRPAVLSVARVEPVFAGSSYPFGGAG